MNNRSSASSIASMRRCTTFRIQRRQAHLAHQPLHALAIDPITAVHELVGHTPLP
jgi:hypothetical protein